jgi:hypothetical protein
VSSTASLEPLYAQASERAFEAYRRAYAHRSSATFWGFVRYGLGLAAATLSVAAGADVFGTGGIKVAGLLGGLFAAALTFLAPGETAEQHRVAAARWEGLDRDATNFADTHLAVSTDVSELMRELDALVDHANAIGKESPNIARRVFARATKRAMKQREITHPRLTRATGSLHAPPNPPTAEELAAIVGRRS